MPVQSKTYAMYPFMERWAACDAALAESRRAAGQGGSLYEGQGFLSGRCPQGKPLRAGYRAYVRDLPHIAQILSGEMDAHSADPAELAARMALCDERNAEARALEDVRAFEDARALDEASRGEAQSGATSSAEAPQAFAVASAGPSKCAAPAGGAWAASAAYSGARDPRRTSWPCQWDAGDYDDACNYDDADTPKLLRATL
ncbi:hypothetical protein M885DRAFT_498405 [Pelagophyceae sp. CCMP2097]|nr:hypothetical protein M885DRAFT_498405 [Pelagophyceae sp. CCMP2097]